MTLNSQFNISGFEQVKTQIAGMNSKPSTQKALALFIQKIRDDNAHNPGFSLNAVKVTAKLDNDEITGRYKMDEYNLGLIISCRYKIKLSDGQKIEFQDEIFTRRSLEEQHQAIVQMVAYADKIRQLVSDKFGLAGADATADVPLTESVLEHHSFIILTESDEEGVIKPVSIKTAEAATRTLLLKESTLTYIFREEEKIIERCAADEPAAFNKWYMIALLMSDLEIRRKKEVVSKRVYTNTIARESDRGEQIHVERTDVTPAEPKQQIPLILVNVSNAEQHAQIIKEEILNQEEKYERLEEHTLVEGARVKEEKLELIEQHVLEHVVKNEEVRPEEIIKILHDESKKISSIFDYLPQEPSDIVVSALGIPHLLGFVDTDE